MYLNAYLPMLRSGAGLLLRQVARQSGSGIGRVGPVARRVVAAIERLGAARGPLVVVAALSSVDPAASATAVEFKTDAYHAVLRVEADAYAGTLQFTRTSEDAQPRTRTLPTQLRHVDDVRAAHGKLLVVGRTNQFNDLLVIYDLASLELLDVILCRELVLSPSGRFAVFERFFPRDAPDRYVQHLTLLYDVRAPPQQNRLPGCRSPASRTAPGRLTPVTRSIPSRPSEDLGPTCSPQRL